jgi:transcriptional regulator with XRE-family HTH domain
LTSEKKVETVSSKKAKSALGERLKRAAHGAGFTSETLSERLGGVTAGAVRRWWNGSNEPSVETLKSYAALTGVSLSDLIPDNVPIKDPTSLEEMLFRWARLAEDRSGGAEAMRSVRGDWGSLDEAGRRELDRLAPGMLQLLSDLAGGEWAALDEPRQREAVAKLLVELRQWRPR